MPARDGTGPLGQGARTGRGMGNCDSAGVNKGQVSTTTPVSNRPYHWGGRVWDFTFGRLFGRRRANRINRR